MNNNFENKNELKVILCIARNLFFHRSVNGNDVLIITSSFRRGKKEKKNFKFSLFAYCALFFFINKNKKFTKEKKKKNMCGQFYYTLHALPVCFSNI